jgi:hypothetical protein
VEATWQNASVISNEKKMSWDFLRRKIHTKMINIGAIE